MWLSMATCTFECYRVVVEWMVEDVVVIAGAMHIIISQTMLLIFKLLSMSLTMTSMLCRMREVR